MKAENRKHFIEAWESELKEIARLRYSLPLDEKLYNQFIEDVGNLRKYITIAADNCFPIEKGD